jgi:Cu(I)/Ag(I) efflux system membrane fusion protein
VTFIDPFLDDATRTVRVRVNLKNEDRRLKPQMYANAKILVRIRPDGTPEPTGLEGKYICPMHPEVIEDGPGRCPLCGMQLERVPGSPQPTPNDKRAADDEPERLVEAGRQGRRGVLAVPVSAVLNTGRRQIAYRRTNDGAYELVEVQLGPRVEAEESGGRTREFFPVWSGLKEGDRVVVQGGFLLDSQRQIEGMPSLLYPEGQSAPAQLHSGHGGGVMPAKSTPAAPGAGHQH